MNFELPATSFKEPCGNQKEKKISTTGNKPKYWVVKNIYGH